MGRLAFLYFFISSSLLAAPVVAFKDNILLAFEKCKTLSVELSKGQLIEARADSFDLVCRKNAGNQYEFMCDYFDTGSSKKISEEKFAGGSNLGSAELKSPRGTKIRFLIGKGFASYEAPEDFKVCLGFYLFEQDALKKRAMR